MARLSLCQERPSLFMWVKGQKAIDKEMPFRYARA